MNALEAKALWVDTVLRDINALVSCPTWHVFVGELRSHKNRCAAAAGRSIAGQELVEPSDQREPLTLGISAVSEMPRPGDAAVERPDNERHAYSGEPSGDHALSSRAKRRDAMDQIELARDELLPKFAPNGPFERVIGD